MTTEIAEILSLQRAFKGLGGNGGKTPTNGYHVPPPGPEVFGPATPVVAWEEHQKRINEAYTVGYRAGAQNAQGDASLWGSLVPILLIIVVGSVVKGVFRA